MYRIIALVILTLISTHSVSKDLSVYFGGWSMDRTYRSSNHLIELEANTNHDMFGVEYANWIIAKFENSFYTDSYALGRKYHIYSHADIEVDLTIGGVHGYTKCFGETELNGSNDEEVWCPLVVPELTYTKFSLQPSIMLMNGTPVFAIKYQF